MKAMVAGPARAAVIAALSLAMWLPAVIGLPAAQRGRQVVRSQLVWVDRAGKKLSTVGDLADLGNLELSPDGKRVAVAVLNETTGMRDLWLYDIATGARSRLDENVADENWLIWSPDGRRVIFNSQRTRGLDLYQTQSRAGERHELLLADEDGKWPVSWSADGRFVLYVTSSQATGNDIWVLPLTGDGKPYPFLRTAVQENWAAFSPNGRWVAYSSTESGQAEVYVTPFPKADAKWLVSRAGGFQARWRRDGKELFFMAPDSMLMAAAVNGDDADFEVSGVKALFATHFPYAPYHAFDVAADGQRFLVNSLLLGPSSGPSRVAGLFP
jgi:Tol biopolymer transport system component